MKKYIAVASLFILSNEIVSWFALTIIGLMALIDFAKEVDRARRMK